MQIGSAGAAHQKVVREYRRTNEVHAREKGEVVLGEAGNDWLGEPRPEPLLVEHGGDEGGEGLGLDLAVLLELVEVALELEEVFEGEHVRGETREADVDLVRDPEHLLEVAGNRLEVGAKSLITAKRREECKNS